MKTKKEKKSVLEIDKPMTITIEQGNSQKIQSILALAKAIENLSKVLLEDNIKIDISNCSFQSTGDNDQPLLTIQTKID